MNPNLKLYIFALVLGGSILGFTVGQRYKENISSLPEPAQALSENKELNPSLQLAKAKQSAGSPREAPALIKEEKKDEGSSASALDESEDYPSSDKTSDRLSSVIGPEGSLLRVKEYIRTLEEENKLLKEKVNEINNLLELKKQKESEDNLHLKDRLDKAMELQNKIKEDFEMNISALKTQIVQRDSEISKLNADKLGLDYQIYELNGKISDLHNANATLERQMAEVQGNKSSLEIELGKLKAELDKQVDLNNTLSKKVSEMSSALAYKEKELEESKSSKDKIASQLEELKANKAEKENQVNQLTARVKELTYNYEDLKKSYENSSGVIAKKDTQIEENDKKFSATNTVLNDMDSKISALQKELKLSKEVEVKTMEQLNQALSLNKSLKKKLMDVYVELELLRSEQGGRGQKLDQ